MYDFTQSLENELGNDVTNGQLAECGHDSGEHVAVVEYELTDLSCSGSVKGYAPDDGAACWDHEVTADSREHPNQICGAMPRLIPIGTNAVTVAP